MQPVGQVFGMTCDILQENAIQMISHHEEQQR